MPKLTASQLVALSSAAALDDAAASRPSKMTNAAAKAAASLVALKLMREVLATPGIPIWRKGEDGRDLSLVLLRAGREAIGSRRSKAWMKERTALRTRPSSQTWRMRVSWTRNGLGRGSRTSGHTTRRRLLSPAIGRRGLLPVSWTLRSGVFMKPEVIHAAATVQPGVQNWGRATGS